MNKSNSIAISVAAMMIGISCTTVTKQAMAKGMCPTDDVCMDLSGITVGGTKGSTTITVALYKDYSRGTAIIQCSRIPPFAQATTHDARNFPFKLAQAAAERDKVALCNRYGGM